MSDRIFERISARWLSGFFTAIVIVFFSLSTAAHAAEVTYSGDRNYLQSCPSWFLYEDRPCLLLAPGTANNPFASGNIVTIDYDQTNTRNIDPDYALGGLSNQANACNNKIMLRNGVVEKIVFGGLSMVGDATSNIVLINGGSVGDMVYGGWAEGVATNNEIIISGGSLEDGVLGGYSNSATATHNVVTISGSPYLADAHIYGGYSGAESGNAFTGNTFNLQSSGIFIKDIGNFEYYNFALPENIGTGEVMITVKETVDLAETTIAISLQGIAKIQKNDKITLISSEDSIKNPPRNRSCKIEHGGSLYGFSIYSDTKNLWAEVTSVNIAK